MVLKQADAPTKQRKGINKLIIGFAGLAAAAIIGTTGIAAATSGNGNGGNSGAGYGNTANLELNVHQSGSHNVLNIILNIFQ